MSKPENRVLTRDNQTSDNFYESDQILQERLRQSLPAEVRDYLEKKLRKLGKQAAAQMDDWSLSADDHPPELKKRDRLGNNVDEVVFHPAYQKLMKTAVESELFYLKYHPDMAGRFRGARHRMGFALGQLYAMSELGQYCPHCMTDGAAYIIEQFCTPGMQQRLLPRLGARDPAQNVTGAMFLTEKSGGSDVGANLTEAEKIEGAGYHLNGEKWFCSNVNAEVIMALARTGPVAKGTRGLSLFLVEQVLEDGTCNPMEIIRLKDKMGVRSMATGEVRFDGTQGTRIGEEGEGFKIMAQMINISRTYNSVAALAGLRRAIIEAWQYLNHRITFGKRAATHPMIRDKFRELGAEYLATFMLVWRALDAMDAAENGNQRERDLFRILTPMVKWISAEQSVYGVRECMELMGGNGYIEDFVMPKIFRDVNVLPIWEGSGNIIVLDILRASQKSNGLQYLFEFIEEAAGRSQHYDSLLGTKLDKIKRVWGDLQSSDDREALESAAKPLFRELIRCLQLALLAGEQGDANTTRSQLALRYLAEVEERDLGTVQPMPPDELEILIGWHYRE
ncbi:MAG: acyl-CoA dehydrogenase family protein [Balneolaceae bacterium]|nr:acyl-CoA dehydrogenase family protein [Balneolaceae bacterium]